MTWARTGMSVMGAAAIVSALAATSAIWLLFTTPDTVTAALGQGSLAPLARELASALVHAFRSILAYL